MPSSMNHNKILTVTSLGKNTLFICHFRKIERASSLTRPVDLFETFVVVCSKFVDDDKKSKYSVSNSAWPKQVVSVGATRAKLRAPMRAKARSLVEKFEVEKKITNPGFFRSRLSSFSNSLSERCRTFEEKYCIAIFMVRTVLFDRRRLKIEGVVEMWTQIICYRKILSTMENTPCFNQRALKEERRKFLRCGALYIARNFWNYKGPKKQLGAVLHS